MSAWDHLLTVLDLGEIVVDDDIEVVVATFDPTDEAIAAWEERIEILNAEVRRRRELEPQG